MLRRWLPLLCALFLLAGPAFAKKASRDAQVRGDIKEFGAGTWIYNDLNKGISEAKKAGRPLLIVFR